MAMQQAVPSRDESKPPSRDARDVEGIPNLQCARRDFGAQSRLFGYITFVYDMENINMLNPTSLLETTAPARWAGELTTGL
ncbi:hypothetical protein LA080_002633 [Diaporthe eres]|nr:hypothetical protein LA080_002633 [Diaporthe eres]